MGVYIVYDISLFFPKLAHYTVNGGWFVADVKGNTPLFEI